MVFVTEPETFYFDFYWPKDVDKNLKHEIEFVIKKKKCLGENKMKKAID